MDLLLENFSEEGMMNVVMNLNDIITYNMRPQKEKGLTIGNTWITPEGCYWLYKLLKPYKSTSLVDDKALNALKNGTNCPETL